MIIIMLFNLFIYLPILFWVLLHDWTISPV